MKTKQNHQNLKNFIESFLLSSSFEGKSERTLSLYKQTLKEFLKFTSKRDVNEINAETVRCFLGSLKEKGLKPMTVWSYYKELKVFFNFLAREELMGRNPMATIPPPKIPKLFPRVLTEEEVRKLISQVKKKSPASKRNYALILFMLDTGLRASEVCSLSVSDVSFEACVIRVCGKGSKERVVPFSYETRKVLLSYLKERKHLLEEEPLFVTQRGDVLTRDRLLKILKRLAERAGLPKEKVSPHVLRHTFATFWVKNGGDAKTLQRILGHSDSRTVDVYVNLTAKDLREVHRFYSPVQRLRG